MKLQKDAFILNFVFNVTYVVVQFYPCFKFYFILFLGMAIVCMVMYDNEFETKENKI